MKNFLFIASFLVLLFTFAIHTADARSGCCSHHGGVCGCGCCDGTSLSSICAPYYPQCNSTTTSNSQGLPTTEPPVTQQPTVTRVQFIPRPTATRTPTSTPTVTL